MFYALICLVVILLITIVLTATVKNTTVKKDNQDLINSLSIIEELLQSECEINKEESLDNDLFPPYNYEELYPPFYDYEDYYGIKEEEEEEEEDFFTRELQGWDPCPENDYDNEIRYDRNEYPLGYEEDLFLLKDELIPEADEYEKIYSPKKYLSFKEIDLKEFRKTKNAKARKSFHRKSNYRREAMFNV